jgi:hypothetical protein
MPRIIIKADPPGGENSDLTLSEHVIAANLSDPHYRTQLMERLTWATSDAEALESRTPGCAPSERAIPSNLLERGDPHTISQAAPLGGV